MASVETIMSSIDVQTTSSLSYGPKESILSYGGLPSPMSQDVQTTMNYFKDADDGRVPELQQLSGLDPAFLATKKVTINDVRGREGEFGLERNGFEYMTCETEWKEWMDEERVKKEHYPEMERFLKTATGASRVLMFNHIIRNAPKTPHDSTRAYKGPAGRPHVDVSPVYAPFLLKDKYPDLADDILQKHRWQLINLWRPLKPVHKDPLAVSDARTIPEKDHLTFTFPSFPGQEGKEQVKTLFTKPGDEGAHRWYYLSGQRPDEVLVFKIFDSDKESKARMVSHTSFDVPGTEEAPTRESIEMRCVVVY